MHDGLKTMFTSKNASLLPFPKRFHTAERRTSDTVCTHGDHDNNRRDNEKTKGHTETDSDPRDVSATAAVPPYRQEEDNDDDHSIEIHPGSPKIRPILKVKSLEDSLRSCSSSDDGSGDDENSKPLRRQSNSYARMLAKLQNIRRKSNHRLSSCTGLASEKDRPERDQPSAVPCHSREPSNSSVPEDSYQAQPQDEEQQSQDQDRPEDQGHGAVPQNELDALVVGESPESQQPLPRRVSFTTISIRNYHLSLIDHPGVSGLGKNLSWNFDELPTLDVEQYELEKSTSSKGSTAATDPIKERLVVRPLEEQRFSLEERQRMLEELGLPQREVKAYLRRMDASRQQRERTIAAQQKKRSHQPKLSSRWLRHKVNLATLDLGQRR